MNYTEYLEGKKQTPLYDSVEYDPDDISEALFPFQRDCLKFLLEIGRGAAFLDTGLGKTILQCEWARHIPGDVLLIAPLAVAQQTIAEAKRLLDLDIHYSKDGTTEGNRLVITNYERLENFDAGQFTGVVLDESSILKGFMSKTKQQLCEQFESTRYKLACTATPAPNDYMELGNHSEFLNVMMGTEMLSRWFINDPGQVGKYKLKGHAIRPFWEWVSSWAACVSSPADLGYDASAFELPSLQIKTETVRAPLQEPSEEGFLFDLPGVNATSLHKEKRLTVSGRVKIVADRVNDSNEPWIVFCESNQESAELTKAIPDAVEVKGSDSADNKESRLLAFSNGQARVIVSKPSICGFGMNWQHCRNIAFASISYSYEKFYQAVRRSWRFGQTKPVNVLVVIADSEIPVWRTIERKSTSHREMKSHMKYAVFNRGTESRTKLDYNPRPGFSLPDWLVTHDAVPRA